MTKLENGLPLVKYRVTVEVTIEAKNNSDAGYFAIVQLNKKYQHCSILKVERMNK